MQSNRILGLVLLVVLLAGAAVAWQVLGADQVPVLSGPRKSQHSPAELDGLGVLTA